MEKHDLEKMSSINSARKDEEGAALVVSLLILALLAGFVAVAISRTSADAMLVENGVSEAATYAATQASLENTTREFVDLFESSLAPSDDEINALTTRVPENFDNYEFSTEIKPLSDSENIVLTGGTLGGLTAIRDSWQISTTARQSYSDVSVNLKRRFYQDRVPIFQFGAFYDEDFELNIPPEFNFGGRVHTNANFFISSAGYRITFQSRITAVGEIINSKWLNSKGVATYAKSSYHPDQSGVFHPLPPFTGSADCLNPSGPNVFAGDPNKPYCSARPEWATEKQVFQGNLEEHAARLEIPIGISDTPLREIIKRGKTVGDLMHNGTSYEPVTAATQDSKIQMKERFANKPGIRISLADSQNKLPGCATSSGACGVRLDGNLNGSIGYQPRQMTDGYQTTPLNATRMAISGRTLWIKIETVSFGSSDILPVTEDITEDILSLGVTERAPISSNFKIYGYPSTADSRSVLKLQRFAIKDANIQEAAGDDYISTFNIGGTNYGIVARYGNVNSNPVSGCTVTTAGDCTPLNAHAKPFPDSSSSPSASYVNEDKTHLKWADIGGGGYQYAIVPFPIQMYDAREGAELDNVNNMKAEFGTTSLPAAGMMSIIEIDMANFRNFLNGGYDGRLPNNTSYALSKGRSLRSTDIPENSGWVVYVSDRRGDEDFDGEYDMEDVYQDGTLTFNEDANRNGVLDVDFLYEAPRYDVAVPKGQAATADHRYNRRAVRLVNGSTLPGRYDASNSSNTRGITVAAETGVYVQGNYNANSVSLAPTGVTPSENYFPKDTATDIPAAIIADGVSILSNSWSDGKMYNDPFQRNRRKASATVVRFALIAGSMRSGNSTLVPNGGNRTYSGGIHNFKRFLESWAGTRLNYAGSLINLYPSGYVNAAFRCCNTVYYPPIRDWTFDSNFLDPTRMPPGTPFIYSLTLTGFERESSK